MKIDWKKMDIRRLTAMVSARLNENGIDALLVGGACVSLYTKNKYLSYDLDFVSYAPMKEIIPVLRTLGFKRAGSRQFIRKDCPFFMEIVSPPPAIGDEPVKETARIRTRLR